MIAVKQHATMACCQAPFEAGRTIILYSMMVSLCLKVFMVHATLRIAILPCWYYASMQFSIKYMLCAVWPCSVIAQGSLCLSQNLYQVQNHFTMLLYDGYIQPINMIMCRSGISVNNDKQRETKIVPIKSYIH